MTTLGELCVTLSYRVAATPARSASALPVSEDDVFDAGYVDRDQSPEGYQLLLSMTAANNWGDCYFSIDGTGVIRFNSTKTATLSDEPID